MLLLLLHSNLESGGAPSTITINVTSNQFAFRANKGRVEYIQESYWDSGPWFQDPQAPEEDENELIFAVESVYITYTPSTFNLSASFLTPTDGLIRKFDRDDETSTLTMESEPLVRNFERNADTSTESETLTTKLERNAITSVESEELVRSLERSA